jgi:outer membrane immunogenic protein
MKIKIVLSSFVAVASLSVGALSAHAADLSAMYKAPPMAVAPAYNWTGFYIGGNVGYGWGKGDVDVVPGPSAATFINLLPQTFATDPKGVIGGGQFGYNWQTGSWVWGVEFDYQGSDMKGTATESPIIQNNGTPFPGVGNNIAITEKLTSFGTLRGRLGTTFLDPRLLLFASGGFAFGQVNGTANTDFRPAGTEQYPASFSSTRTGWAAGGGAAWAFAGNWSARVEYLHLDLGSNSVTASPVPALPPFSITYNFHNLTADIVRFGVDYKF